MRTPQSLFPCSEVTELPRALIFPASWSVAGLPSVSSVPQPLLVTARPFSTLPFPHLGVLGSRSKDIS